MTLVVSNYCLEMAEKIAGKANCGNEELVFLANLANCYRRTNNVALRLAICLYRCTDQAEEIISIPFQKCLDQASPLSPQSVRKSVKSWWTIYGMRLCQLTCLRRKRSSNKEFPTWKSLGNFLAAEQQQMVVIFS